LKVALDTNILVYADGVNGADKQAAARTILGELLGHGLVIPAQCLGELYRVLTRKAGWDHHEARQSIVAWRGLAEIADTSEATLMAAIDMIELHPHQVWDAIAFSASAELRCRAFLTEDLHDGFHYGGMTVINPFLPATNPLLALLRETAPKGCT
jgi:predicted nucleic acid-binding protein